MLWVIDLVSLPFNPFQIAAMEAKQYQLRSQGSVEISSENLSTIRKRRKPNKKRCTEESDTDSTSMSTSSSFETESTDTDSSTTMSTMSSSLKKPRRLQRKERSETSYSESSSEVSDSESSTPSSETSQESVSLEDYTHMPDTIATVDHDILRPDYTGITLSEAIRTDALLMKWLTQNGLLAQVMRCPTHMVELVVKSVIHKGSETYVWMCPEKSCTVQLPITTGTIFTLFKSHPRKILIVILDWLLGHQRPETMVSSGLTKNTVSRANGQESGTYHWGTGDGGRN